MAAAVASSSAPPPAAAPETMDADAPPTLLERVEDARALAQRDPALAAGALETLLAESAADGATDPPTVRAREGAIMLLGQLYNKLNNPTAIAQLVRASQGFLAAIAKAKATKIVRALIDCMSDMANAGPMQVALCIEMIAWSTAEKRTYLKQSLEARLVALYLQNKQYTEALALIGTLLRELKRLDDKMMLVEVQLLESKVCLELRNIPKARAALTAARTSANAIYTPPLLQASLDIQSGILHAEEKDFKTAFSYFYEALEGFSAQDDPRAVDALKYMILCKIMLNTAEDISGIINNKTAMRHVGPSVDAMRAVSKAAQNRSLKEFEAAMQTHGKVLHDDPIMRSHLKDLYSTLLEQNLHRIIEPYSRVEVAHVAQQIDLPLKTVESKLSQMILDKKLLGIVDQEKGYLVVFAPTAQDKTFEGALSTLQNMNKVVDALYVKTSKLS